MKFVFGLQKVLDARRIEEEIAMKNFAIASRIFEEKKKKHNDAVQCFGEFLLEIRRANGKSFSALEGLQNKSYLESLSDKVNQSQSELEKSEVAMLEKKSVMLEAMKQRKMLENLKERHFDEFKDNFRRVEQNEMDDDAMRRSSRNRKETTKV